MGTAYYPCACTTPVVDVAVHIGAPWGPHAYNVLAQEMPARAGGAVWPSGPGAVPNWTESNVAVYTTFTTKAALGSQVKINGNVDGSSDPNGASFWNGFIFCDASTLELNVAIWATIDDGTGPKATPSILQAKANGFGGCDTFVQVTPAVPTVDDQDGDGFSPNTTGPLKDCDDTKAWIRPGEVELTGDMVDDNCDGSINPPRIVFRETGVASGASPLMHPVKQYPSSYAYGYVSGYYETGVHFDPDSLISDVATGDIELWNDWNGGSATDLQIVNGACVPVPGVTFEAFWDTTGIKLQSPVPVKRNYGSVVTCHWLVHTK